MFVDDKVVGSIEPNVITMETKFYPKDAYEMLDPFRKAEVKYEVNKVLELRRVTERLKS